MERRAVLKLVALSALSPGLDALSAAAACHMEAAAKTAHAPDYKLQFFSEHESQLLDQLMEMIIPADSHSPGAHATRTDLFADVMVFTSDGAIQKQWRSGLRQMEQEAKQSSLAGALQKSAKNEANPQTELDHFFLILKQMTLNGYYTSSIGIHQDLRYLGNTYVGAFPGCTHPEHQG